MPRNTDRREFLKGGLLTTAAVMAGGSSILMGSTRSVASETPDIVIAHGPNPAGNARSAVEALGGIKRFVKRGDKVLIKPNMSFASGPERAANTNPAVVREVAMMCSEAGASKISILDNCLNAPADCLRLSKIPETCKSVPNTYVDHVKAKRLFREVPVKDGLRLKTMSTLVEALEADVLIAVPIGKSHAASGVSLSMKGMMGLISDRIAFHSRYDLHEAIVDMITVLKPRLVVIDGTRILSSGGPGGPGKVIPLNLVVASTDMVAADAQMVALGTWYGKKFEPGQVRHIRLAAERELGRIDLDKLNVVNIKA